jgi:hypothetical protein
VTIASECGQPAVVAQKMDRSRMWIQSDGLVNSTRGKPVAVLTLKGIHSICMRSSVFKHTVVTREAALRCNFMRKKLGKVRWIMGPRVRVQLDADYEVSLPIGYLQGSAMKVFAHKAESIEEFCSLPLTPRRFGRCS